MANNMGFPSPPPAAPAQGGGLLGKLGGMFGGGSYGGLLGDEEKKAAQQQALLAMSAQLMAAGGPSPTRTSFGQALGPALMAGQQAYGKSGEDALQALLIKSQIQKAQQKNTQKKYMNVGAGGSIIDPETGQVIYSNPSKGANTPSNILEWDEFQKMTPEQKKEYLEMKRNTQPWGMADIGGVPTLYNKSTADTRNVSSLPQEVAGQGAIAEAKAGSQIIGEQTATAQMDLPRVEDNANQMLALLDKLEKHPGRTWATGKSSILPLQMVPGSSSRDFSTLLTQVGGKQFLEAFNSLKGAGQITEIEGKKATDAIARIQDTGQSEQAYLQAINELREVVTAGTERARRKAGVSPSTQSQTTVRPPLSSFQK
jgi:hypothetical protein